MVLAERIQTGLVDGPAFLHIGLDVAKAIEPFAGTIPAGVRPGPPQSEESHNECGDLLEPLPAGHHRCEHDGRHCLRLQKERGIRQTLEHRCTALRCRIDCPETRRQALRALR
jgi:hypothetical protein